ncbi:hypothetical protein H4219_004116 [Mycoemilia scoparia]|uniref:C2H2-type domain-containing protein n=1 Tax=Mycoemilia scoparia TaxID=417184 RepID=A0A9W8DSD1_9FUNG|nr:hypothetical protein H4219_004116 [Mycoemilia scoparia]
MPFGDDGINRPLHDLGSDDDMSNGMRGGSGGRGGNNDRNMKRDQFGRDRRSRSPHYGHGHRGGRSRSPPPSNSRRGDDGSGDRDRYIPNYEREGYQPGPRYGRGYGDRPSSRGGHHRPPTRGGDMDNQYDYNGNDMGPGGPGGQVRHNRMGLCDPRSISNVVSFQYYCEWIKSEDASRRYTKDEMHEKYEQYRREALHRLFSEFYAAHKDDDWFIERYSPDNQEKRLEEIVSRKLPQLEKFLDALRSGSLDNVCFDAPENLSFDRNNNGSIKDPFDLPETSNDAQGEEEKDETNTLFIRTIPPSVPRKAIEDECKKLDGFEYLTLSIPNASRNFHRFGWVKFKEGTDLEKPLEILNNLRVDEFQFHFSKHRVNSSAQFRLAQDISNSSSQLRHDLKAVKDAVNTFEQSTKNPAFNIVPEVEARMKVIRANHSKKIDDSEAVLVEDANGSHPASPNDGESNNQDNGASSDAEESIDIVKQELDIYLAYLRRVHFYCYYCCKVMDSAEDFSRQCSKNHYRRLIRSASNIKNPSNLSWAKNIDQKNESIIYPPEITEMAKQGGKSFNEETEKLVSDQINHLDEGRFRCLICKKLFRGDEFVRKHIRNKHPELIPEELVKELEFFNRFVLEAPQFVPLGANQAANASGMGMPGGPGNMQMMGGPRGGPNNSGMMMTQPMMMGPGNPMMVRGTAMPYGGFPMMGMAGGGVGPNVQMRGTNGMAMPMMFPWMAPQNMVGGGGPNGNVGNNGGNFGSSNGGGIAGGGGSSGANDSRSVRSYVDLDAPADGEPDYGF